MMNPTRRIGAAVTLAAAALVQAACAGDAAHAGPSTTRETIGDTTVIRVAGEAPRLGVQEEVRIGELDGADEYTFGRITDVAVAADGRIYVLDGQALNVRIFAPDGAHLRTFGRSGGGPGELKQPGGMVFLADGRLLVRDPGNTRMNIYSADGEALTTWPIPGGFFTSAPVFTDRAGRVYSDVIVERDSVTRQFKVGLMRMDAEGTVLDTIRRPYADYQAPTVSAQRVSAQGSSMSMSNVPFWPQAVSTLNREGEFVGGISDRYAVDTWRADGTVLRLARDVAPAAVDPAEAQTAVERTTRSMRNLDAAWKWNAPEPPATKPFFREVRVGEDGRIWVQLSQPAVRQPPDPDARPDPNGLPALDSWIEPMAYDIFEGDGRFVGTVALPDRFRLHTMRGDHVWGVIRDELDVQYVVRLKIVPVAQGS